MQRVASNVNKLFFMQKWADVIKQDLRQMDLTWEEANELANDKAEWRRRVAQCSHLYA